MAWRDWNDRVTALLWVLEKFEANGVVYCGGILRFFFFFREMEFDDPDDIFRDDEDDADARFSLVGWLFTHYSIFFSFNMKWNEKM